MSDFDPGIEIEMVAGTPSPGASSIVAEAYTIITSTTAITTLDHAHTLTPTQHTSTSVLSTASLDDSLNRETLSSSPPHSSASHHQPQPEQQSTRSAEDTNKEKISHEHIESLFHCQQMIDIQWQGNIDLVPKYLSSYHPADSVFVSNVRSLVDTSLSVLRTYSTSPQPSQSSDTVPSFLHAFCMEAAPLLFSFLKHSAFLQGVPPQSPLFQRVLSQVQQFIQLLFCISQRSQIDKVIIKSSDAIYNILTHFPDDAPAMIFSSLSSLSISNNDHVLGAMYILSDLGDFSKHISSSQCDAASQWIDAALSMELDHDDDHTIEIMKSLYWTSYSSYIHNISDSNRVVHLQPFREFIKKHLKRTADIPIVMAYYLKLAKLNFEFASTLLKQVFVELGKDITFWNRYNIMEDKLRIIGDLVKLIMASTLFDEYILLNRLQSILESDAVPFVVPTGEFKDNNTVYRMWTSVKVPGVDNYELILRKAAQLLANPLRDYTKEISEFVSTEKHISDVHHCIYGFAKYHNDYEVPVPVQLIPHAINAISNPDILPAAKEVVYEFLDSNLHNLSLEPIAGASMDLDVENVTSQHGIDSILEYKLSSALSDNIITAINHILETRRDISMEARMNARSLLESLDHLGEALTREYHRQHPPTETPHLPPVNNRRVEERIREYTQQVLEQYGTGGGNNVDMVAEDGDGQMDVNAEMGRIMHAYNINQFDMDLDDEDEDVDIDDDGDDGTIVRTDVHDHSLFIQASLIDQRLSSAPIVPANVSNLFQHMLMYHSDTLLSDRSLCKMVLEFRPDIWGDLASPFIEPHQTPFFMLILRLSIRIRQHIRNPAVYSLRWSNLLASVCADSVASGVYESMRDHRHVYVGRGQDAQFHFNVRRYAIMFESHDFAGDVAMAPRPREAIENLKELAAAIDSSGIFGRGGGWHEIDPARLPAHWESETNLVKLRVAMAMRFCATLNYALQQL
ncbi:hypothetical protein GQ42DRAFT_179289 [Ramicandelaber brevisporus]|nr:hypothetical protein GQ42DRAFT_179289 [Ramicandelaber brevisporus]